MSRKKLLWQIFPPFLVIILCALVAVTWTISRELSDFQLQQTTKDLNARATLAAERLIKPIIARSDDEVDHLCKTLGEQAQTRFTVILSSGKVIGDTEQPPQLMDNHAKRPEVAKALQGEIGTATRFSQTLQQNMLYVAIPVIDNGEVLGSIRASLSMTQLEKTLSNITTKMIGGGVLVALIASFVALVVSRKISIPLGSLQQGATRFAGGSLDHRLPGSNVDEINGLAEAMNSMASQLDERLRAEIRQRNEQEAILASMIEGVIAINEDQVVLRINNAAINLLDNHLKDAVGRKIGEVTRKVDLLRFVDQAQKSDKPIESPLTLFRQSGERYLQALGSALNDADGKRIGTLIVVHDVTRLRKLENLRRDFVANVSHELKTPITAIKGAVETLKDIGPEQIQEGLPFLDIASRQTDRLNAIIEDLLALSRLERDAETEEIQRTEEPLLPIIESAYQACAAASEQRDIEVKRFCSGDLKARVNAALLEQAIVNLLNNAIKYSDQGSLVSIEGWQDNDRVKIKVQDRGQGIPAEHLPRLFERFYRVDAARSRAIGGTGLGLAIVKHIIQAHHGEVSVNSQPGVGSVFLISLPVA